MFPMFFLYFPMVFLYSPIFSYGFPMVFLYFPMAIIDSPIFSYGFPMVFLYFPMDFLWFSYGFLHFAPSFPGFFRLLPTGSVLGHRDHPRRRRREADLRHTAGHRRKGARRGDGTSLASTWQS